MRYAFISDIHSNLKAFSAVLNEIDERRVYEIVCLGDIVGYNANPNECVGLIKERSIKCIMGNHDARVSGLEGPDDFNDSARQAVFWTRKHITQENLNFLKNLPRRVYFAQDKILAVHGSIDSTDEYILSPHDVVKNFRLMDAEKGIRLCFFGHTHVRTAYKEIGKNIYPIHENKITVEEAVRYLVNPSSVGQPRDGDPRGAFLIYDADAQTMEFFRVAYDINTCYEKIARTDLPRELAERLIIGE